MVDAVGMGWEVAGVEPEALVGCPGAPGVEDPCPSCEEVLPMVLAWRWSAIVLVYGRAALDDG